MMKLVDIAIKDLYQIFKDWKISIFFLVAPIIFTLMFGFMFGGFSGPNGDDKDNRLSISVVNEEQTPITGSLLNFLEESDVIRVKLGDPDNTLVFYQQSVIKGDVAAVLLIPEGFSQEIREDEKIPLEIILEEDTAVGLSVKQGILSQLTRIKTAADAASHAVKFYEEKEDSLHDEDSDGFYDFVFDETLRAWQDPPVIAVESQTSPEGEQPVSDDNAFAHSLPGMMAQFAIAGLIGAAEIIVQERKSGALDRLRSTAVSQWEILAGHWLAMFGMILIQFIMLVVFGQLFLRLKFFSAPLATLALSMASCAFVASLGMLIGVMAKMPEQTVIFALIPMFIFSSLGGAWVPMELLGELVQKVSLFTPVAWIMLGFKDILLRGAGLPEVLIPILILLGFSTLFLIPAAIIFFRREH